MSWLHLISGETNAVRRTVEVVEVVEVAGNTVAMTLLEAALLSELIGDARSEALALQEPAGRHVEGVGVDRPRARSNSVISRRRTRTAGHIATKARADAMASSHSNDILTASLPTLGDRGGSPRAEFAGLEPRTALLPPSPPPAGVQRPVSRTY